MIQTNAIRVRPLNQGAGREVGVLEIFWRPINNPDEKTVHPPAHVKPEWVQIAVGDLEALDDIANHLRRSKFKMWVDQHPK